MKYTPANAESFLAQAEEAGWKAPALEQLRTRGLPTPKLERWKYTNLAGFAQSGAKPATKVALNANPVALPWMLQTSRKFLFVNGHMVLGDARLKVVPDNLESSALDRFGDEMLWALNTALMSDGPNINILEDGAVFEIIHVGQGGDAPLLASPRTAIRVATNTSATVIEQFLAVGDAPVHTNHATEINLKPGAKLNHIRIQMEASERTVLNTLHARVARDASYNAHFLNLGASLSRQEYWVELEDNNSSCAIKGAQLMHGRQHMDTTVHVDHKAPHCASNQTIRNVLAGEAVGVFQGKIHVDRVAQKTDGYQLCNTLMLSERATMNTKPELEIYADDVKCSHGTTTGKLDETPLFYMRARGIPEAEARRMMLLAFIGDLYDGLPEFVGTPIAKHVEGWLNHV
ncbi:MAG: Fe-S cluster assembly protein SufD [Alphaproteobacteria bacterium]|nr:Fe-S cluster assembly protein SufD [Alphaproteobacteria bacterium]